jgi:hypothetical protein
MKTEVFWVFENWSLLLHLLECHSVNLGRGLLRLLLAEALFDSKVAAKQTVTCGFILLTSSFTTMTSSTTSISVICIHLIVNLVQRLAMFPDRG